MLKHEQSELRRINTASQVGLSVRVERSSKKNQLHGRNIGNWDKNVARAAPETRAFPSWILELALEVVRIFVE